MAITPARARRRAVARLLQQLQHAVPGVVLIGHGLTALQEGAHGWHQALAVAEVATSAAVIAAFLRAIKVLRDQLKSGGVPHPHYGIDWIDVFLAAMLATESWSKWMVDGHIWRANTLLALATLTLALFGGRIAKWKASKNSDGPAIAVLVKSMIHERSKSSSEQL